MILNLLLQADISKIEILHHNSNFVPLVNQKHKTEIIALLLL